MCGKIIIWAYPSLRKSITTDKVQVHENDGAKFKVRTEIIEGRSEYLNDGNLDTIVFLNTA